jgi:hypothetical protein
MWFKAIITILALAALAAGAFCWFLADNNAASSRPQGSSAPIPLVTSLPKMEGIYVTGNNEPCFQIKMTTSGTPLISDRYWRIEQHDGTLIFYHNYEGSWLSDREEWYPDPKTGKRTWAREFAVAPSVAAPGDWDLVARKDYQTSHSRLQPLKVPVISFLHRLDDPRVIQYLQYRGFLGALWQERKRGVPDYPPHGFMKLRPEMTTESLLRLATAIAHDHPGDLHAQLYRLTALLDARDFQPLERELAQWRPQFERNGVYTAHFRRIAQSLKALQLSAAGRNAADLITSLTSRRVDQPVCSRLMLDIFKYDSYAWNSASVGEYWSPDFLALQTQAKVNTVFSDFMLLRGQRAPALQLVAANYRMGQLLNQNDSLISRFIGLAVRNIDSAQLGLYTLNACETPAELSQLWQTLEMLNRTEGQLPPMRELLWEHEWASCIPEAQWPQVEGVFDDYQEALTRHGVADARFQLVRMAAATRGKQLMLGMLPKDSSDLGPLFLTGAPLDPFTSAPLHLRPSPSGVTCYSFGPDRTDDLGAITYDPSNGAKREYMCLYFKQ